MPFSVRPVESVRELEQIVELQRRNLIATADGFVTVRHTVDVLKQLHVQQPSLVAHAGENLAGYALSMAREAAALLPILQPMFVRLDAHAGLNDKRWYVMGQICVAEAWRGSGVFVALYAAHRQAYGSRFDALVTEIATRNGRSLRAHARVGFTELERYRDPTDEWSIVAWFW